MILKIEFTYDKWLSLLYWISFTELLMYLMNFMLLMKIHKFGPTHEANRPYEVRSEIWLKLWGNLTFNPISALTHSTLVDICQHPKTRELATLMMTEAQDCSSARSPGLQRRPSHCMCHMWNLKFAASCRKKNSRSQQTEQFRIPNSFRSVAERARGAASRNVARAAEPRPFLVARRRGRGGSPLLKFGC